MTHSEIASFDIIRPIRWCSRLASPWLWAKARSKLGAVIRLCRDGVMPNVAIMGVFCIEIIHPSLCTYIETDRSFRPATALRMRKDGVPASPWLWAKARSKLGAVIRLCGDGVMPNVAIMGVFCIEIMHPTFLAYVHLAKLFGIRVFSRRSRCMCSQ
jgi:hypothetical protein